jgi:hypothetical protein
MVMSGVVVHPSVLQTRRAARAELGAVVDVLVAEFDGLLPTGAVIAQVTRSREHLLGLGVRSGLAVATEAMARVRLLEQLPFAGQP